MANPYNQPSAVSGAGYKTYSKSYAKGNNIYDQPFSDNDPAEEQKAIRAQIDASLNQRPAAAPAPKQQPQSQQKPAQPARQSLLNKIVHTSETVGKDVGSTAYKAGRAVVRPAADIVTGQGGKAAHDTAQLSSDVTGGTLNQFSKAVAATPKAIYREARNKPIYDIQEKTFGTTDPGKIAEKIAGSTVGTASLLFGGGEAKAGEKGFSMAAKFAPGLSERLASLGLATGAKGAVYRAAAKGAHLAPSGAAFGASQGVMNNEKPTDIAKSAVENAAFAGGAGFLGHGANALLGKITGRGKNILKNYTPSEDPHPDEKKAIGWIVRNPGRAMAAYNARVKEKFGGTNVVAGDEAKYVIPGFDATKSLSYHEPGSALAKAKYDELLSDKTTTSKPVLIMAGGTGAGKTSALKQVGKDIKDYAAVIDTNSNNLPSTEAKIKAAIDSGRQVEVAYVYRDPHDAFVNGVLPRAAKEGRIVGIGAHVDTHYGSLETIQKLADKYKGDENVDIRGILNTGKPSNAMFGDIANLPKMKYNRAQILSELRKEIDNALSKGQITKDEHSTYLADAEKYATGEGQAVPAAPQGAPKPQAVEPPPVPAGQPKPAPKAIPVKEEPAPKSAPVKAAEPEPTGNDRANSLEADKLWEDKYAAKAEELDTRSTELTKQLKEAPATRRPAIRKQLEAVNKQAADHENAFMAEARQSAPPASTPPKTRRISNLKPVKTGKLIKGKHTIIGEVTDKSPEHIKQGLAEAKTLSTSDVAEHVKAALRHYVERGETAAQLRAGSQGGTLGNFAGDYSIGGDYHSNQVMGKMGPHFVGVHLADGRVFKFKLDDVISAIKKDAKKSGVGGTGFHFDEQKGWTHETGGNYPKAEPKPAPKPTEPAKPKEDIKVLSGDEKAKASSGLVDIPANASKDDRDQLLEQIATGYSNTTSWVKDTAKGYYDLDKTLKGGQMRKVDDLGGAGQYIRTSEHTPFYRDFYAKHGKVPTLADYEASVKNEFDGKGGKVVQDSDEKSIFQLIKDRIDASKARELAGEQGGYVAPGEPIKAVNDFFKEVSKTNTIKGELNDKLDSLKGNATADKEAVYRLLKGTEKFKGPDLEAAYHYAEDKTAPVTDAQKKIYDEFVKPLQDATAKARESLKNSGVPMSDDYIHRIAMEKGSGLEQFLRGEAHAPRTGGPLRKTTDAMKGRTMKSIVDEQGSRTVVAIKAKADYLGRRTGEKRVTAFVKGQLNDLGRLNLKTNDTRMQAELKPVQAKLSRLETEKRTLSATASRSEAAKRRLANINQELTDTNREYAQVLNKYDINELNGKTFQDRNGKRYTIGEATTKEIEANTKTRYYKNPIVNSALDYISTRQAERANQFLEDWKNQPEFKEIALKDGQGVIPSGWKATKAPQFIGYHFEPKVAEVLDDFAGRTHDDPLEVLNAMNRFLRTTIFFNPLIHIPNVLMHWVPNRGLSQWVLPKGYYRLLKYGGKAISEVAHTGPLYTEMLREGAPFMSFDQEKFADQIYQMMDDQMKNPGVSKRLSEALGYADPVHWVQAWYKLSHAATWYSNDILTMQAILEEMDKGKSMKAAIDHVGDHIPNYRVPTRIAGSRALRKGLTNPNLTMFSAYHYGVLKNYATTVRDMVSKNTSIKDKGAMIDKLLAAGVVAFVAYPLMDQVAKKLTGNQNSIFRRAGPFSWPQAIYDVARGHRSVGSATETAITPAPGTKGLLQLWQNKDSFGNQIFDPGDVHNPKQLVKDISNYVGTLIAPVSGYQRAAKNKASAEKFVAGLFGISQPKSETEIRMNNLIDKQLGGSGQTVAQKRNSTAKAAARQQIVEGKGDSLAKQLVTAGILSQSDLQKFKKEAQWSSDQRAFDILSTANKLTILQKATPKERTTLVNDQQQFLQDLSQTMNNKNAKLSNRQAAKAIIKIYGGDGDQLYKQYKARRSAETKARKHK